MKRVSSLGIALVATVWSIAALHYGATLWDWYYVYEWFDIPMHVAGGVFIGILFVYLFGVRVSLLQSLPRYAQIIFGLGCVVLIGVFWAFYVFWIDVWAAGRYTAWSAPASVHADTLLDLVNDLIGGLGGIVTGTALAARDTQRSR